jgi:glycerol-3-phosphate dehydrogenase
VAQELGLSPQEGLRQAATFLVKQSQTRVVALGPEQAQQEALAIASVRAELGVDLDSDAASEAKGEAL